MTEHHIFHALIIAGFIGLILFVIFAPKKFKKISLGKQGLELQSADETVDPDTPCPYKASKETTQKSIQLIEESVKQIKDSVENVQVILKENENALKQRQNETDERFIKIETSINRISKKLFKVSQGTLENMLFDESQSLFKRLKAYRRLTAMGVNGKIQKAGINLILAKMENKDIWDIVKGTKLGVKIVDKKYYDEVMAYIDRVILDAAVLKIS